MMAQAAGDLGAVVSRSTWLEAEGDVDGKPAGGGGTVATGSTGASRRLRHLPRSGLVQRPVQSHELAEYPLSLLANSNERVFQFRLNQDNSATSTTAVQGIRL